MSQTFEKFFDRLLVVPALSLLGLSYLYSGFTRLTGLSAGARILAAVDRFISNLSPIFYRRYNNDKQLPPFQVNSLLDTDFSRPAESPGPVTVMCSKMAYESPPIIKAILDHWGDPFSYIEPPKLPPNASNETEFFIAKWGSDIIVTFRGTEGLSIVDWGTDFLFTLTDFTVGFISLGKIHTGFVRALGLNSAGQRRLADAIYDCIQEHATPESHIYVTGHSLGGALAMVFGSYLIAKQEASPSSTHQIRIFTYGQPRVGDKVYARKMEGYFEDPRYHLIRVVNNNDIVPRVPPTFSSHTSKHDGFSHISTGFCYIDRHGDILKDENPEFPPINFFTSVTKLSFLGSDTFPRALVRFLSLTGSLPSGFVLGNMLGDHLPPDYVIPVLRDPEATDL
eukprot:m.76018 g.76018  ORF g.76018 m.76018 type:complete len:395 (+) comp20568_c0_seq1:157-1341(+)